VAQPNQQPDIKLLPDSEISHSESNHSESNSSEVNPLLNPLLAANMGRWAEVYFTNPPEKRDQAIHQLLRELRGESAVDAAPAPIADHPTQEVEKEESVDSSSLESNRECSACGHDNPAEQKFCGMCGTPMAASADSVAQPVQPASPPETSLNEPEQSSTYGVDYPIRPARHDTLDGFLPADAAVRNDYPRFAVESESAPYRYRLYIGVALALVIGLLLYKAWHGTGFLSSGAVQHSAVSNAAPAEAPEPANSALATDPVAKAPGTAPVANAGRENASAAAAPTKNVPAQPATTRKQTSRAQAGRAIPAAERAPEVVAGQSGAEDFAVAERYLQPGTGRSRDSKEAAQWLWKAVSKGNVAATVTLSDLYLRGDGVPKSCDQGRLLLDAAARKGGSGAYERLRHLQAFGCE
jgi:hypothetical protein